VSVLPLPEARRRGVLLFYGDRNWRNVENKRHNYTTITTTMHAPRSQLHKFYARTPSRESTEARASSR
jgi:hypothetical protein